MTNKKIIMTSMLAVTMFMAPIALGGFMQTTYADPGQGNPGQGQGDGPQPACPDGTEYNPSSDKCESVATCPAGQSLNTATDLCEETVVTGDPICGFLQTYNPSTNLCTIFGFPFGGTPPTCNTGTLNPVSDKCEILVTSAPICANGTYSNSADLCQLAPVDGKVTICHNADDQQQETISIDVVDVAEHVAEHGDTVGACA